MSNAVYNIIDEPDFSPIYKKFFEENEKGRKMKILINDFFANEENVKLFTWNNLNLNTPPLLVLLKQEENNIRDIFGGDIDDDMAKKSIGYVFGFYYSTRTSLEPKRKHIATFLGVKNSSVFV